jgi:D,D-heptose 1,7-bisphosphate phosphatase
VALTRAVFFDKDGTLVEDVPYNVDPGLIVFRDGAEDCLRALHEAGFALFIVSNQSGVARGIFDEEALAGVEQVLRETMDDWGLPLAGFYYCPHLPHADLPPEDRCVCRKPEPGLLLRAAREHAVDLARSWLIGDILEDTEAGRRAGCRTVLLDTGRPLVYDPGYPPNCTVRSLAEVAAFITGIRSAQPQEVAS